jgi:ribosomal protein S18 acetylase RimI-like enzyme
MLQMVVDWVSKRPDVSEIYLHVQTNNAEALKFYQKHGFIISSTIEKYYNRIEPTSAHVLSRAIGSGKK